MSPQSSPPAPLAGDSQSSLGQALRLAREAHGVSLDDAAAALRIKAAYLRALETGHYDQLPGTAYAIGFVRTYAEYLGLNGADLVQRFKAESTGGQGPRATLTFPSPAPRGRVPGLGPLLIALIVAALIGAVWFFWRNEAQNLLSSVPEVPERLRSLIQGTGPTEAPVSSQTATGAQILPPPIATAPTAGSTIPMPPAVTAAAAQSTVASAVPAPPVPPQPPIPAPAEPVRHLAPIPPPAAAAPEDQPPPPPEDTVPAPTAQAVAAPPAPPPVAAPPADGRVFGAVNDPVRVIIRSKGESWVQVRDGDNQAVMTRVLRAGDQYRVPNRPGLTLMTGNAGALEVTVDGAPAPALGPIGMVRRAVPLDPERLKQGTLE